MCECVQGADEDSVWTSYLIADTAGNRLDSYRVYLEPVRATCSNLQVIEGATATKVMLGANGTATGVEYKTSRTGTAQVFSCLLAVYFLTCLVPAKHPPLHTFASC